MYAKRGQITLFVIIAVIVVVVVLLGVFLGPKIFKPKVQAADISNPGAYISSCLQDPLKEKIEEISPQSGYEETKNCIIYGGKCRRYLCYQEQYYQACVNQEPQLQQYIESLLKRNLEQNHVVLDCFNSFVEAAKSKGYEIQKCSNPTFSVNLTEKKVLVPINCEVKMSKDGITKNYESIIPYLEWPLYDFIETSQKIIDDEITNKDFDPMSYMLTHYWVEIQKFQTSNGDKIFILTERNKPDHEFVFAVRNYPMPPGIL
jgi:hypothetical protein